MKMSLKNKLNKMYLFFAFFAILLLVIYNFNLMKLGSICIIGDEFGYWATGAHMAGMDWSEVASYNAYYSYGYGFWLSFILRIFSNSISAYRAAIILNSVFVLGIYTLLVIIARRYIKFQSPLTAIISGFVLSLYSGLFFASQSTQCETVLAFFFVLELYLLGRYLEQASLLRCLLLLVNTIYLYCIHQRAIVVIIALIITLFLQFLIDKQKRKYLLISILFFIALMMISNIIKNNLLENLYLGGKAVYSNNYSGQTEKIQMLTSFSGIRLFIKGVLGKIYYLGASTFGIFYLGLIYFISLIVKSVKEVYKGHQFDKTVLWYIFNILTFLGIIMIATIQLMDNRRTDTLIYGRYSEFIVFPFLLGGIHYAVKSLRLKNVGWIIAGQLALAMVVINQLFIGGYQKVYTNNVSGIAPFYHNTLSGTGFIYTCTVATTLVMILFIILNLAGRTRHVLKYTALVLVGAVWLHLGYASANNQLYSFKDERSDVNLYSFLSELPDEFNIVYSPYDEDEDEFAYMNADYLQFIAYDRKIFMQEKKGFFPEIKDNEFLVTQVSVPEHSLWYRNYRLLAKTSHFTVLAPKGSQAEAYYLDKYGQP